MLAGALADVGPALARVGLADVGPALARVGLADGLFIPPGVLSLLGLRV